MTPTVLQPRRFQDARGWFSETWNARDLAATGIEVAFCQDNHSFSRQRGTLRGLHFQSPPHQQAKLIRCLRGRIFDVAVDIRRASPTFARWVGVELTAEQGNQLFVPAGYAHGFLTLEDDCEVAYKVDAYYDAASDMGIAWDDPDLAIAWPDTGERPILSDKDTRLPSLRDLTVDFTYDGQPLVPLADALAGG
jgi:dTDP-4-dehydrorhamnose 3,5-epimerase